MDSLGRLSSTLPSAEAAEKELQAAFRGAALSLTGLFKQGKKATAKAYIAGKREALQDVLEFLQTSLDHPPPPATAAGPLNVARLIDYICARQETLKAEEEGDNDDEDNGPSSTAPAPRPASPSRPSMFRPHTANNPPAPSRPASSTALRHPQPHASTSSAPSSPAFSSTASSTFSHAVPTPSYSPFPFTAPSSPLASGSSSSTHGTAVGVPSPLTRSQARQQRGLVSSGGARERKGKNASGIARERGESTTGTTTPLNGAGATSSTPVSNASSVDGLKRRWGQVATADVALSDSDDMGSDDGNDGRLGGDEARVTSEGGEAGGGSSGSGGGGESMELELDGWDGVGERPNKRLVRHSIR